MQSATTALTGAIAFLGANWPYMVSAVVLVLGVSLVHPLDFDGRGYTILGAATAFGTAVYFLGWDQGIRILYLVWCAGVLGYILERLTAGHIRYGQGPELTIGVALAAVVLIPAAVTFVWVHPPDTQEGVLSLLLMVLILVLAIGIGQFDRIRNTQGLLPLRQRRAEARAEREAYEARKKEMDARAEAERRQLEQEKESERQRLALETAALEERRRQEFERCRQEDDDAVAIAERDDWDRGVTAQALINREVVVLENLYRVRNRVVTVKELAAIARLSGESTWRTLSGLVEMGHADVEALTEEAPAHWWMRRAQLTDQGRALVRKRHQETGLIVNNTQNIGNVTGNVGGPGGSQHVSHSPTTSYGQHFSALDCEARLVDAVKEMQSALPSDQAKLFDDELEKLASSPTGKQSAANRIVTLAGMVGKVGAPVIEAGRKLYDALHPGG